MLLFDIDKRYVCKWQLKACIIGCPLNSNERDRVELDVAVTKLTDRVELDVAVTED